MPSSRIHRSKRADKVPPSKSELRANLQGSGGRDSRSDAGVPKETVHLARSYGPAGMPRSSVLLASRREVLLGASGLVLRAMCPPPASLHPSGQEPWGDGTLWSDGLGWIA
jgi:hypothetical protein